MAGLASYSRIVLAGKKESVGARGNFVSIHDGFGPWRITTRASQIGEKSGQAYTLILRKFEKWYSPTEFDSVEVENISDDDAAIELLIGYGDFTREVTSRSQVSKFITTNQITADSGGAGGLPGQLLSAENLVRKRIIIRLFSSGVIS